MMKNSYFILLAYVVILLLLTPLTAVAGHQYGHPSWAAGEALRIVLMMGLAGFVARLLIQRRG